MHTSLQLIYSPRPIRCSAQFSRVWFTAAR